MTRSILLVGAALISVSISPLNAEASEAPWCAVISKGDGDAIWDCTYGSIEKCRPNVIAGDRGFCNRNPYYGANPTELRNSRQASQRSSKTIAKSEKAIAVKKESPRHRATTTTAIKITTVKPEKVATAAKPTAAKPRNKTEPVEEKANSRNITEPGVPPSTQPLATPGPIPEKEPTTIGGKTEGRASDHPAEMSDPAPKKEPITIGGKTEGPASGQRAETSRPVPEQEPTTIAGRTEGPASDQLSETSDPVLKKAKITVAAKMEDPASVEFVDIKRAVNKIGQSFEIICGHVKGKKNSGEVTGEKPFLYLVKEDEAFIVLGNPDSMAAIVYRTHCISANSR